MVEKTREGRVEGEGERGKEREKERKNGKRQRGLGGGDKNMASFT